MYLTLNGEKHNHCGDGSVSALLAEIGAIPEHTALTVNGELLISNSPTATPSKS
jgi:sulfur carrier protein ThiS